MKKVLSLILALILAFSLSACGDPVPISVDAPNAEYSPEPTVRPTPTPAPTPTPTPTPTPEQIDSGTPEKAPEEEASEDNSPAADIEENHIERGVSNGNVYESEFLGIGCKLPEGWMIYGDDQLEALMGLTAGFMQDENSREALEQMDGFFDFFAYFDQGRRSMNILLQNMGKLFGLVMDEDSFVDSTLEVLKDQLEANGMINVKVEEISIEFAGKERRAIHSAAEFNGAPYYTTSIFLKSGNYMATLSLASYNEDICSSFADYFYALD